MGLKAEKASAGKSQIVEQQCQANCWLCSLNMNVCTLRGKYAQLKTVKQRMDSISDETTSLHPSEEPIYPVFHLKLTAPKSDKNYKALNTTRVYDLPLRIETTKTSEVAEPKYTTGYIHSRDRPGSQHSIRPFNLCADRMKHDCCGRFGCQLQMHR